MSLNIPTLAEIDAEPFAERVKRLAKPVPHPIAKKTKQKAKDDKDDAFRKAIWKLDGSKSRATGKLLVKSGTMSWDELGEVDHVINRSTAPERVYDLSNGILLSKAENRLKKTRCPKAVEFFMFSVEGPDDRRKPQRFIWRDEAGKIIKETRG